MVPGALLGTTRHSHEPMFQKTRVLRHEHKSWRVTFQNYLDISLLPFAYGYLKPLDIKTKIMYLIIRIPKLPEVKATGRRVTDNIHDVQ